MQLSILANRAVNLDQKAAFFEAAKLFVEIGGGLLGAHGGRSCPDIGRSFAGRIPPALTRGSGGFMQPRSED
jgi:hypothetical protein